jgi:2,4-dienoyl-CoA reductase-like NADH-dependent reductase (Old Yellow Enzyme family)/thioredoxin reductase
MKLFTPAKIGKLEMKNRIIMPAMGTGFAEDGEVTERMIRYYEERAKGGVGLIIVEVITVERRGWAGSTRLRIDSDKFIPGLKKLANSIKKYGARAAIQLQHSGVQAKTKVTQMQSVGPSPLMNPLADPGPAPKVLSIKEIHDLVSAFADAAVRAKKAGYEAIELHGTHSYLIDQFMSPHFNKRTDMYGGSPDNRARFACEIVESIKNRLGEDFPVTFRMTGNEYVDGGITLEDAKVNAQLLQKAGVDCISMSVGVSENMVSTPPMSFPKGCFVYLAEGVKKEVDVPVVTAGRINDPVYAEQILQEEKADLIAIGRPLIADPYFPRKAEKGEFDEIVPCIACNLGCIGRLKAGLPITCLANPTVGKEMEYQIEPTKSPKKVLIAGAGPAGMEAARVLALRGHSPVMYEKENRMGGQLNLAWIPPYKKDIKRILDYYETQIKKLKIEVHLGASVNAELIKALKPDVLIICTGASPKIPEVLGMSRDNVVHAVDVIAGKVKVGGKILILGSRRVALETAELLCDAGNTVKIVARADGIGLDLPDRQRMFLVKRFSEKKITAITNALVKEVQDNGLLYMADGKEEVLNGDYIVFAWGSVPEQSLVKEIEELAPDSDMKVFMAGDCISPRDALDAIHEGARIAREL